jgi:hypothetical protein
MTHWFLSIVTTSTIFFSVSLSQGTATAQAPALTAVQSNCPHTRAQHVPESINYEGSRDCGTVKLKIAGAEISAQGQGCPILASHTLSHEIEVPSATATRTQVHAQVPSYIYHFSCKQMYFVIIPWGSYCEIVRNINGAPQLRMNTVSCPPE